MKLHAVSHQKQQNTPIDSKQFFSRHTIFIPMHAHNGVRWANAPESSLCLTDTPFDKIYVNIIESNGFE